MSQMNGKAGGAKRRGVTLKEWLSQPNKQVTRGELWWMLNYYEANRRKASPLWRGWMHAASWFAGLFRRRVALPENAAVLNGRNEANPPTDTPLAEDPAPKRAVYDANGRVIADPPAA